LDLLIKFLKKVMSFKAGNIKIGKDSRQVVEDPSPSLKNIELNALELEMILKGLKNTTFTGEQLETIYKLVLKLQDNYLSLTKK